MGSKFRIIFPLALVFTMSCRMPAGEKRSEPSPSEPDHGANHIGLFPPHYAGIFGDGQPTWRGMWYRKENLSVIAHLPTKSEFFIYVCHPEDESSGITNNIQILAGKIRQESGAKEAKETWETINQEISIHKKTARTDIIYLRSEFTGSRSHTDRYSKLDRVTTVVFVGCLTPERPQSKAVYSVAFAMIPLDVPREERERLLGVLSDFLNKKITYFL